MALIGKTSRRQFLFSVGGLGTAALLVACSQATTTNPAAATPTTQAKPTTAATPTAQAKPTTAPAGSPTAQAAPQATTQVSRAQTLILGCADGPQNQFADVKLMNPFLTGITRSGYNFAMEPLYYYNPYHTQAVCGPKGETCTNGEIPWLAESYSYNKDFTQVTVKIRPNVTWSDGQPFTASDVAFTINMLKDNAPKLTWSTDMQQWVKDATAVDAQTAQITLTNPNPRFFFSYFMFHEDIGIQIQPEHIWKGKDPSTFTNFDLSKGWPVVTGPWHLASSSAQQKVWLRRSDWWAAKTGFHALPKMLRIIYLPEYAEPKLVQLLASNEADQTLDLRPNNVKAALQQNPKLSVWTTNNASPYGYLDWWPVSLGFNDSKAPYSDPDIRWAINHAINRKQIVDVGYGGAATSTVLPYPNFPALLPYLNGLSGILKDYPIDSFDLTKTAQMMQAKGYAKNQQGYWAKNGTTIPMVIDIFQVFQDITPVLVEQLRKAGFNAAFKEPADASTIEAEGNADAYLNGHGGSVRDPYFTLRLYENRFSAPTGKAAVYPYRWDNQKFDTIVDQMAQIPAGDPKLETLFHQAMSIWIPALPDIGIVQWYHRIPVNTTYWQNWPNEANPYINTANWHRTSPLWINEIQPTSA